MVDRLPLYGGGPQNLKNLVVLLLRDRRQSHKSGIHLRARYQLVNHFQWPFGAEVEEGPGVTAWGVS